MNVIERFWSKVNKTETCWLWTGATTPRGYGLLQIGTKSKPKVEYAHRIAMQIAGFRLDGNEGHHACPNKNCVRVNNEHVQVVPRQRNPDSPGYLNRLKTHCPSNHPLSGDNLMRSGGNRNCRLYGRN